MRLGAFLFSRPDPGKWSRSLPERPRTSRQPSRSLFRRLPASRQGWRTLRQCCRTSGQSSGTVRERLRASPTHPRSLRDRLRHSRQGSRTLLEHPPGFRLERICDFPKESADLQCRRTLFSCRRYFNTPSADSVRRIYLTVLLYRPQHRRSACETSRVSVMPKTRQIRAARSNVRFERRASTNLTISREMPACFANSYIESPRASRCSRITSANAPQIGAGLPRGMADGFTSNSFRF